MTGCERQGAQRTRESERRGKNGLKEVWRVTQGSFGSGGKEKQEGPAGVGEEGGTDRRGIGWDRKRGRRKMQLYSPQLRRFRLPCASGSGCDSLIVVRLLCKNECVYVCLCVCVKSLTAVLLLSDSADNIAGVHEAKELRTHKQT